MVIAFASLVNQDIDVTLATDALKDIIPNNRPKKITVKGIQKYISDKFDVSLEEILSIESERNQLPSQDK